MPFNVASMTRGSDLDTADSKAHNNKLSDCSLFLLLRLFISLLLLLLLLISIIVLLLLLFSIITTNYWYYY